MRFLSDINLRSQIYAYEQNWIPGVGGVPLNH